jgi:hypothetical protein
MRHFFLRVIPAIQMVTEGFDEDSRYDGMQRVYGVLDQLRAHGLAQLDAICAKYSARAGW